MEDDQLHSGHPFGGCGIIFRNSLISIHPCDLISIKMFLCCSHKVLPKDYFLDQYTQIPQTLILISVLVS